MWELHVAPQSAKVPVGDATRPRIESSVGAVIGRSVLGTLGAAGRLPPPALRAERWN